MKVSVKNTETTDTSGKPVLEVAGGRPERDSWPEFFDGLLRTALLFAVVVAVVTIVSRKAAQWAG